jgi:hypothetical protein
MFPEAIRKHLTQTNKERVLEKYKEKYEPSLYVLLTMLRPLNPQWSLVTIRSREMKIISDAIFNETTSSN